MAIDIVPRKARSNIFAKCLQNKLIFYENPIKQHCTAFDHCYLFFFFAKNGEKHSSKAIYFERAKLL
jgi:hypothetical protein